MSEFDLLTDKADIAQARWVEVERLAPPRGGVAVELERFALTANNFTYAKFGDEFRYWRYFPAPPGFGRMPVWGVARIVASAAPGFAEGERIYGFLPISTRTLLTPARGGGGRFLDSAPHRADLPPTYNEYWLMGRDSPFDPRDDAFIALRPLFSLGFFLSEHLAENRFFGAREVIVSSASSKAAWAIAHQLAGRVDTVGLTSAHRVAAVERTGLFGRVAAYSAVSDDGARLGARAALFVDVAGDGALERALRRRLGARLVHVARVGATHPAAGRLEAAQDGESEFFFAPAHIVRLRDLWGAEALREKLAAGLAAFLRDVGGGVTFSSETGRSRIAQVYADVAQGRAAVDRVPILSGLLAS